MKLYVGLGNPGKEYEKTRHNVGFRVLDAFAEKTGLLFSEKKFKAAYGKIRISGEEIMCVKPLTYMNLSGEAVQAIVSYYQIDPEDIVIIHDDIDLPCGKLRLRKKGSGGGHNGVKNILQLLGTKEIKRIRIGVGKNGLIDQKDYVLGKFSKEEEPVMAQAYDKASEALVEYATHDFEYLMNKYNVKDE